MASLGHIAVGMAAARVDQTERTVVRPSVAALLFWSALSFMPDADVIGFAFGVQYGDPWGHRGATHSFAFALIVGALVALAAPRFRYPALRTGLLATLVVASHAVLDTLTDGGLGAALFWPFDLTRYFAPWRPLPVSPIGLGYLSPYGMYVAACEVVLFAPLVFYAMRWRLHVAMAPLWTVLFWLLFSPDPFRERAVRLLLQDDTVYAAGFTDERFATITDGMTEADVRGRLGDPFRELTGGPGVRCLVYSRSPDGGYFRARAVCLDGDRVTTTIQRWVR